LGIGKGFHKRPTTGGRVFGPADGTGTITEEMQLARLLNLAFGFAFVTTGDELERQLRA
jgi:hypothetical protein